MAIILAGAASSTCLKVATLSHTFNYTLYWLLFFAQLQPPCLSVTIHHLQRAEISGQGLNVRH